MQKAFNFWGNERRISILVWNLFSRNEITYQSRSLLLNRLNPFEYRWQHREANARKIMLFRVKLFTQTLAPSSHGRLPIYKLRNLTSTYCNTWHKGLSARVTSVIASRICKSIILFTSFTLIIVVYSELHHSGHVNIYFLTRKYDLGYCLPIECGWNIESCITMDILNHFHKRSFRWRHLNKMKCIANIVSLGVRTLWKSS